MRKQAYEVRATSLGIDYRLIKRFFYTDEKSCLKANQKATALASKYTEASIEDVDIWV